MRRRALHALALAGMLVLAGCMYDTTTGIEPHVSAVTAQSDGNYRIELSVSTHGFVETFHEVRVYGYARNGDIVCTGTFGTVDNRSKTTMYCAEPPSVLAPASEETGTIQRRASIIDPFPESYHVRHILHRYAGYENGTHYYVSVGSYAWKPTHARLVKDIGNRPTPTNDTRRNVYCEQLQDSRSFAALGNGSQHPGGENHWNHSGNGSIHVLGC